MWVKDSLNEIVVDCRVKPDNDRGGMRLSGQARQ